MTTPRTLILATRNQGKVRELRDPLARFGFDVQTQDPQDRCCRPGSGHRAEVPGAHQAAA